MLSKLCSSLTFIALAMFMSGALFPPGDVPKQLFIVTLWFTAGAAVMWLWTR